MKNIPISAVDAGFIKKLGLMGTMMIVPIFAQSRESNTEPTIKQENQMSNQNNDLKKKHCVPCEGKAKAFNEKEENDYLKGLPNWTINRSDVHSIARRFIFRDFKEAMRFVNAVAELAESENHHPDMAIFYNSVAIELHTHAIRGLSENDFILAAKIDELLNKHRRGF